MDFIIPDKTFISQDFHLLSQQFHIKDENSNTVCVARINVGLKAQIQIFKDDALTQLLFSIVQQNILGTQVAYYIYDAENILLGGLQYERLESLINEHWQILDKNNQIIGVMQQKMTDAVLGKMMGSFGYSLPQSFVATVNNTEVCEYIESSTGIIFKMSIDFTKDTQGLLDRVVGLAAAILFALRHVTTN